MGLKIYLSSDLDKLASKLGETIKEKKKENPFTENFVVIQTEGLKRWVSIKLAENEGVSFLNTFLRPNALVEEMFKLAGLFENTYPSVFDVSWYIFELLDEEDFKEKFQQISKYYKNDDKKRYSLAFLLADIFDQYQIYRSEYIEKWNSNEFIDFRKGKENLKKLEEWQKYLWLKLKEKLKEENKNIVDRVELVHKFKELYDKNEDNIKDKIRKKFSAVHFFGFSYFTRYHLEILMNVLSKDIDVFFYLFNPAPNVFWYDEISEKLKIKLERINSNFKKVSTNISVGNRLLMDFGTVARNTMKLIFDVGGDNVFNTIEQLDDDYLDKEETLLKKIQTTIINDETENIKFSRNDIKDGSIQIHKHYSELREVEGVYNFILSKIEEGIKPHEILVMTTDIDKYTPYIQAVFDNYKPNRKAAKPDENDFIPYRIADRSFDKEQNLINIFKKILEVREYNFTPEFILSILDFNPLRNKFGIKDVNNIRSLLSLANIRMFIEGKKEDETELISWQKGLKRLLAGYMILEDKVIDLYGEELLPIKEVEGILADEVFSLILFVRKICKWIKDKNGKKTIEEWVDTALELLKTFFDKNDVEISSDYDFVVHKLSDFEEIKYENEVSFDVFYEALQKVLVSSLRGRNFISGAVTFASIIPLRSVPYKVIAVLGLGSEHFPRLDNMPSFNLLKYEKKWQDRSTKDGDNYLFLETLLSAQDTLYLSYVGWDIKSGKEKPASSIIDILNSFVVENCKDCNKGKNADLVISHGLHLYYVKEENKNNDYSYVRFSSDVNTQDFNKEADDNKIKEKLENLNFYDIYHFYKVDFYKKDFEFEKNIYKNWFLSKFFHINYEVEDMELPEIEEINIDALNKYDIKKRILEIKLFENNVEDKLEQYKKYLKHKGILPLSAYGNKKFEEILSEVNSLLEKVKALLNKEELETPYLVDTVEFETTINCEGNQYTITGSFDSVIKEEETLLFLGSSADTKAKLACFFLKNNNIKEEQEKVKKIVANDENVYNVYDNTFYTEKDICNVIKLAEKLFESEKDEAENYFETIKKRIKEIKNKDKTAKKSKKKQ